MPKFPYSSLLEILSVGFPFCGFKILSGMIFQNISVHPALQIAGTVLLCLGILDAVVNALNFVGLLFIQRRILEPCSFAILTRLASIRSRRSKWSWQDLGNSMDVLLSLVLVAFVIGQGWIKEMNADQMLAWNICVIFNVLGAGLARFGQSLKTHWAAK